MIWKPHITVAAVIERDGRFLVVEEQCGDELRLNQPAGHLEENESLLDAVKREVLEETAWSFEPEALVGIHLWRKSAESPTFLRVCFSGQSLSHDSARPLDGEIVATHWLSREELHCQQQRLRTPLVLKCIDEYRAGERYPLSLLKTLLEVT